MTGFDLIKRITDPKEAASIIYGLAHHAKTKEEFMGYMEGEISDERLQNIKTELSRHGKGYPISLENR